MCQEAGSAISIDALNYPPTVMAQVVLIRSNYGCRNVYVMYVCERAEKIESTPSDSRRAEERLAAIPERFDRLLTCAQLSHTRSTRGSAVKSRNLLKKDLILTLVT